MRITIAQRYRPFSHLPGVKCLIPGTSYSVQIFPALIKISDLSGPAVQDCGGLPVNLQGPVEDFTVQADLEKGNISVSGKAVQGYVKYRLELALDGIRLIPENGAVNPQVFLFPGFQMRTPPGFERLSLGSHKAQNWPLVEQRQDLTEILPVWLKLGQMTPGPGRIDLSEPSLLALCEDPDDPYKAFLNLWKAGFEGIMSPRAIDQQFQGFPVPPLPSSESPLALLTAGAALIRKLFIGQQGSVIDILPSLPVQFHCGRMTGIAIAGFGTMDMEWSKKQVRRIIFNATAIGEVRFRFQKGIRTMRLRTPTHPKGMRTQTSTPIDILPGERYLLDRFEH